MAGRLSLDVVEKHQEVESRNAEADARWAGYETGCRAGSRDRRSGAGPAPEYPADADERRPGA